MSQMYLGTDALASLLLVTVSALVSPALCFREILTRIYAYVRVSSAPSRHAVSGDSYPRSGLVQQRPSEFFLLNDPHAHGDARLLEGSHSLWEMGKLGSF